MRRSRHPHYRYVLASFAIFILTSLSPKSGRATTINVADDQTIQQAIDASVDGDVVEVAPGRYRENIDFKGKAITLQSSKGPRRTIIAGGGLGGPIVTFDSSEGNDSVLSGFTITGGRNDLGGGIFTHFTSPTILGNIITRNFACTGAAISVNYGSPIIRSNTITKNEGSCSSINNGAVDVSGSDGLVASNFISQNIGGGLVANAGGPTIIDNFISQNQMDAGWGGGIYISDSFAIVAQNVIANNRSGSGAGIFLIVGTDHENPVVVNNTIVGNDSSSGEGSAVYSFGYAGGAQLFNNLIIGKNGQTAMFCDGSYSTTPPVLQNNDVFTAHGLDYGGVCSATGNISSTPMLVDPASHNFRLLPSSPAIDAGSNSAPNLPATDFYGKTRIVAGRKGDAPTVDVGASEFQPL